MTDQNKTALVTGASSGIGTEIARLLAADGYSLILAARRAEQLNALADELKSRFGVAATASPTDLSKPGAAAKLWKEVTAYGRTIDVLINNAGIAASGALVDIDPSTISAMLNLNVVALTALAQLALCDMRTRGRGRVLNVASVAGYQPGGPGMAVYYATKNYVLSLTRALSVELRGTGVTVTALCPGPTHTELETTAGVESIRLFRWLPVMDARTVAEVGVRAMHRGRVVAIPGFFNKLLAIGGELPPRSLALSINRILLQ